MNMDDDFANIFVVNPKGTGLQIVNKNSDGTKKSRHRSNRHGGERDKRYQDDQYLEPNQLK